MHDSSAEERTLEPTPRRIERMRRAGDVVFSRELVSGFALAVACVVLVAGGKAAVGSLLVYMQAALAAASRSTPPGQAMRMGLDAIRLVLGLPFLAVCAVALLVGLTQTRGNLAGVGLRTTGGRLMPRLGRVMRRDGGVDLLLDVCKLGLMGAVACWALAPCLPTTLGLHGAGASRIMAALGVLSEHLAVYSVVAMVGLGVADYLLQTRRHRARWRMTRDEARREQRENEGAPEHKWERQRRHREGQSESRDLHEAALLVVDPRGGAVAIAYSPATNEAPVVIAKGEGLLARRVETLAQVEGIPVFVDPELVHTLSGVEVGSEIPEGAYTPIAELMIRTRRESRVAGTSFAERPTP